VGPHLDHERRLHLDLQRLRSLRLLVGAPGGEFRKFLTGAGTITCVTSSRMDGSSIRAHRGAAKDLVLRARRDQDIDAKKRARSGTRCWCRLGLRIFALQVYFEETKLVDWAAPRSCSAAIPMHVQMFVKAVGRMFMAELRGRALPPRRRLLTRDLQIDSRRSKRRRCARAEVTSPAVASVSMDSS